MTVVDRSAVTASPGVEVEILEKAFETVVLATGRSLEGDSEAVCPSICQLGPVGDPRVKLGLRRQKPDSRALNASA